MIEKMLNIFFFFYHNILEGGAFFNRRLISFTSPYISKFFDVSKSLDFDSNKHCLFFLFFTKQSRRKNPKRRTDNLEDLKQELDIDFHKITPEELYQRFQTHPENVSRFESRVWRREEQEESISFPNNTRERERIYTKIPHF